MSFRTFEKPNVIPRPEVSEASSLKAVARVSPWFYIGGVGVVYGVPAYRELNSASLGLGEYESFKKAALDPYVAMRSAYYVGLCSAQFR